LQVIADRAGVSRVTVSHILGGKFAARYKEATRERVQQLAQELNYRPNRAAQTIKNGRSNLIAIVHFGAGIEAAYKTNHALAHAITEKGFDYFALDMNWYGNNVDRALSEIIRIRVEGVIISHIQPVFTEKHIRELQDSGIPVVGVNGQPSVNFSLICDDAAGATRQLTEHLIKGGKRTILYLSPMISREPGNLNSRPEGRIQGFSQAIKRQGEYFTVSEDEFLKRCRELLHNPKKGVKGIHVVQDTELYSKVDKPVYRFCSRLFAEKRRLPDAIMCRNDFYAIELFATAMEYGIRIPEDLAVTGYDNDQLGSFAAFGVTTAEQNTQEMCTTAVDVLLKQIACPGSAYRTVTIPSKLIIRTSCGGKRTPSTGAVP